MTEFSRHGEWLSLIDVSGPFLAEPVLKQAFPQGLEPTDSLTRKHVRLAYDEWREAMGVGDPDRAAIHQAWIDLVLKRVLELEENGEEDVLRPGNTLPASLAAPISEHEVTLRPDYAVVEPQNDKRPLMFVAVYPADVNLGSPAKGDRWAATPAERMVELCRALSVRLGLVTNGECWMLVDAPVGGVTSQASWYARLWGQEPVTLQAFVNLLGIRRFFTNNSERLPALLNESLKIQDEVTDALGKQVRRAVEVLIQAVDRADVDRNRELLASVDPPELYEAALTVMMRIVFLLSAEERGLLLLDDENYQAFYAVSTLRTKLRAESEEILERRQDAWSRLLAIFRAVYGGIEHEALKLPALGGSLFDPDRFPFLEGRIKGTRWKEHPAAPLPIDNRTVMLLLDAVQLFEGRVLSYRALDIEQIGYVYEGLLERTVVRAHEVTLDLDATKGAKKPWVMLHELESAAVRGDEAVQSLLRERTGSSASRVKNDLAKPSDDAATDRLLTACHGDRSLRDRITPYLHFLRVDRWGYPLVYPIGTFMVMAGAARRETGTHYTPKSLTETIVKETMEPLVYIGPAEGKPRESWALRRPGELLDLKICDPAMGSGAFLVQACRWLSERLVEAWAEAEEAGSAITSEGEVINEIGRLEPLRGDAEDRVLTARRLIAERCLYGVDMNPLAVELAKLSIWLITLAKGRPFGFLDHNLRRGDSLLGIHEIEQLLDLDITPAKGTSRMLFAAEIDVAVERASALRVELHGRPIRDIADIEIMASLNERARRVLSIPGIIADALTGAALIGGSRQDMVALSIKTGNAIVGSGRSAVDLSEWAQKSLRADLPASMPRRHPFHWPLEFPEVFRRTNSGFDALVGNPPFLGGRRISTVMGPAYNSYLAKLHTGTSKNADLVSHFFRRAFELLRYDGQFGLLATNTIAEGDTRQGGLEWLLRHGATIYSAYPNEPWPGVAAVVTSRVHVRKGGWDGRRRLAGKHVHHVSAFLSANEDWSPKRLKANRAMGFQGSILLGKGFVLTPEQALPMLEVDERNADVVLPYLNGHDLNTDPEQRPSRWAINFWDWTEERSRTYHHPYEWIKKHVYPERVQKSTQRSYRNILSAWWLHWNARQALYHTIGLGHYFEHHPKGWVPEANPHRTVLAVTRVSKTLAISFVPTRCVFSDATVVFSTGGTDDFAVLQSSLHSAFAWQYSSRLKSDLRYSPTDALEPFPFPVDVQTNKRHWLRYLGSRFHDARSAVMLERRIGLTKLYNLIHDEAESALEITQLRESLRDIDQLVLEAYGWTDLNLDHGFHEVAYLPEGNCTRFTISEVARIEVLRRLSRANRERYDQQQGFGSSRRAQSEDSKRSASGGDLVGSSLDGGSTGGNHGAVGDARERKAEAMGLRT